MGILVHTLFSNLVHLNYNVLNKNKISGFMKSIVIGFSFSLFKITTFLLKTVLKADENSFIVQKS